MPEFVDKRFLMAGLRATFSLFLLVLCVLSAHGQQAPALTDVECDQKLAQADAEFNAGHFYVIPSILNGCLTGGKLSKDQLVQAYLLLCQAYLILDDPTTAGDNYLKLLREDPEFVPNEHDHPIDIVYLSKQYTATPIFTPHFRLGLSASFFKSIYSLSTEPYPLSPQNPLRIGFQLGAGLDWNINDNLSLCIEGDIANRGYQRIVTSQATGDETNVQANQWWIDVPLYVKYTFAINEVVRPFGYVGAAANYLISANNQFTYTDIKSTGGQLVSEGPAVTVTNQRNQFSWSLVAGGGVRYKIGKNFVYADLRYMAGMSNLANEATIYYRDPGDIVKPQQIGDANYYLTENITRYHYLSDLFKMDNLSLTFGFVKPLYDPRKVKKARTKDVARSIRKEGGKKK
jgi:opacity protein-like surface antigen